ncbi:MAG: HD domain-containing phosphohydrolase [Thermodesulfobacteriota bacterium]
MEIEKSFIDLKKPWVIIAITFLLLTIIVVLGNQSFKATEEAIFDEFNQRQLVLAKEMTSGIKLYFESLAKDIRALGMISEVQRLDEVSTRREIQRRFNEVEPLGVNDIGVLDANGVVRYTVMAPQIEGSDFSWRRYYQKAKKMTHSDTYIIEFIEFKGIKVGQRGILLAVPMFETTADEDYSPPSGKFAGVVICTFKLDTLTQRFVAHVKSSERGHVFLIDNEYNVLWAPDRSLFGKNLLEEGREFPAFQQIVKSMVTGNSGTAEYFYYKFDDDTSKYTGDREEKLIAYSPIDIGNNLWAIGIWAPKEDARKLIRSVYRKYQLLVGLIILIGLLGSSYVLAMSFNISKKLKKDLEVKTSKLKESRDRLEVVKQLGTLANSSVNLDEVLKLIIAGTLEVSGATVGMIFLKDAKTEFLTWGASAGLSDAFIAEFRDRHIQPGEGLTGRIAQTGKPIYIPRDSSHDPRVARAVIKAEGLNSFIGVPLYAGDDIVGVMNILTRSPKVLGEYEITLVAAIGTHVGMAIRNAQLFEKRKQTEEKMQKHLERIDALRSIDMTITASLDLRVTLNVFINEVSSHLHVDAVDVLLLNPYTMNLEYSTGKGFKTDAIKDSIIKLGEYYPGRVAYERKPLIIPDISKDSGECKRTSLIEDEEFKAYCGIPLIVKGNVKGVLEIFHRSQLDPDKEWIEFFEALAGQAAIAIDNATMFDDLQRSRDELILAYDTTIEGWSRALDYRDKETEGHSQRVTEITVKVAHNMGMSEAELVHIRRGALLHDIGKLGVPDSILLKSGKLTDEEWDIMKHHPVIAYELLSPIAYLRTAILIPYCHHEKWDGTGYPRGLKGEEIPLAARIFAVVDIWDALNSERPYRSAWPRGKVRKHIRSLTGTHLDPKVVEVFLKI